VSTRPTTQGAHPSGGPSKTGAAAVNLGLPWPSWDGHLEQARGKQGDAEAGSCVPTALNVTRANRARRDPGWFSLVSDGVRTGGKREPPYFHLHSNPQLFRVNSAAHRRTIKAKFLYHKSPHNNDPKGRAGASFGSRRNASTVVGFSLHPISAFAQKPRAVGRCDNPLPAQFVPPRRNNSFSVQ